jgi:hypothetical protein
LASVSSFVSWIRIIGEKQKHQQKLGKLTSEILKFMQSKITLKSRYFSYNWNKPTTSVLPSFSFESI